MHPLDVGIVLCFVGYAVHSGLRARSAASENLTEYFLAGRGLSGVQAGLSMAATQFAADTPLLVTGLIASSGVFSLWRLWIYALAFLLLGFLLAPCWRRSGVLTDAELCELRYEGKSAQVLRAVKAIYFGVVFNCAVLAMVLFAAARIVEPFLLWHAWLPAGMYAPLLSLVRAVGVPLGTGEGAELWVHTADNLLSLCAILVVTAFYSTTGGLRSVVRTDVAQLGLALTGTAIYAWFVVDRAGGMSAIVQALPDALAQHPDRLSARELLAFTPDQAHGVSGALLSVLALQWLIQMNSDGTGYLAQRCMACRSDADARRATVVFSFTQILLRSLLWLPIGIGLLVLMPPGEGQTLDAFTAEREASYVRGMAEFLPVGARGLLLTAMLAALASTLDTHLNWGASYLTNDLYGRFYCQLFRRRDPDPRAMVRIARLSNLLIVGLSLFVMTRLDSIQTAWTLSLLLGAGMGVMLLLRWLWSRVNAVGELSAVIASSVLAPLLLWLAPDAEAARLLWMAVGAGGAGVIASLASAPENAERLSAFYRRVRPPGFWEAQRRDNGEPRHADRRRLWRGLGGMLSTAAGLFCALVGMGSWLVSGTPPVFVPSGTAWIAGLLAIAALCLWRGRRFSAD